MKMEDGSLIDYTLFFSRQQQQQQQHRIRGRFERFINQHTVTKVHFSEFPNDIVSDALSGFD
jgi:hypothetical protein